MRFQNFSSLQFIKKFVNETLKELIFQNFSSLQFIQTGLAYLLHTWISKLFKFTVHENPGY